MEQTLEQQYVDKFRYYKAADGLARLTGKLEGKVKFLMMEGNYDEALDIITDLIYIHSDNPISNSEDWVKEYKALAEECHTGILA